MNEEAMSPVNKIDASVGLMFPASIFIGFVIGYYLDKLFNTEPVLLIVFVIYGIVAAFINLFKTVSKKKNKED